MSKRFERLCGPTNLAPAALALLLSCAAVSAQAAAGDASPASPPLPPGAVACSGFTAFANDPDPNGLNVRAEPDAHAKILGRLPPPLFWSGDYKWYAGANVIGFKKGWFLIEGGEAGNLVDEKTGAPATKFAPYTGRGWVSANLLVAQLGSPLKAAPSAEAAEVVQLGSDYGYQDVTARRIFSCSARWLHVEIPLPAGSKILVKTDAPPGTARGWVDGTCEQQRTTCDFAGWQWSPPAPTPLPQE